MCIRDRVNEVPKTIIPYATPPYLVPQCALAHFPLPSPLDLEEFPAADASVNPSGACPVYCCFSYAA